MCRIFQTMREPLKQIAIWIGVVSLVPLSTWYGTAAFSPPPDWKAYNKRTQRLQERMFENEPPPDKEKLRQEQDNVEQEFQEQESTFYRDLFWVAYPVGLLAVIGGIFFPVQPVGSGCVFGGMIALGTGCYSYWDKMDGLVRIGSLVLALLILMVLGSWRFWPSAARDRVVT